MNKNILFLSLAALVAGSVAIATAPVVRAQQQKTPPVARAAAVVAPVKLPAFVAGASAAFQTPHVAPGGKGTLIVTLAIKPGFHVNYWNDKNGVPTTVEVRPASPEVKAAPVVYPPITQATKEASGIAPTGYAGTIRFASAIRVAKNAKPGARQIPVSVTVQGCNATSCFPPETIELRAPFTVTAR